ncbi:HAD family hydrolase [Nitratireductor indicus C115]|uniref:HAD family hydrolase n=1 Tax=Nitratireductor indicus C115 TaxID=1231190 RepID=K2PSH8_9HYPH|nr:HAD-IA family hydrolase [Nitratireductor indicus]EKF44027.1 HAD family hydrolase [Nitratireductor indicus C115]SFQ11769.1 putative hydrolase of the HAD superfamily [Nitratireductor indicus]
MKRCLMLDVDGVLINGRPEDGRSWATDIERDLGIPLEKLSSVFFAPHWEDIVSGRKNLLDTVEACLPLLAPGLTAIELIDYWFSRDSRIDESLLQECDELRRRDTHIFLATNQEHMRAEHLMERLALEKHVDGIIYSAKIGARKPQPAFFEAASRLSGFAPANILLVDDTKANVEAAVQAGWRAEHWFGNGSLLSLVDRAYEPAEEIPSPES